MPLRMLRWLRTLVLLVSSDSYARREKQRQLQCTTALLTCYAVHDAPKAPVKSDTLGNYRATWTAALAQTLANKAAVPKPFQRKSAVITACGSARDKPLCQLQSRDNKLKLEPGRCTQQQPCLVRKRSRDDHPVCVGTIQAMSEPQQITLREQCAASWSSARLILAAGGDVAHPRQRLVAALLDDLQVPHLHAAQACRHSGDPSGTVNCVLMPGQMTWHQPTHSPFTVGHFQASAQSRQLHAG